jgi:hypothetical protein
MAEVPQLSGCAQHIFWYKFSHLEFLRFSGHPAIGIRSRMQTRRHFLARALATAASTGSLSALNGLVRPAFAEPLTLLFAMNLAANAVGLFAQGGNGLSAMLSAQFQLLNLMIDQLKRIQLQLIDVSDKISRLPEDFAKISKNQYAWELIQEIAGAAGNYAIQLDAFKHDQNVFESPQVQRQLTSILDQTAHRRGTLSVISDGAGPEAAFVVPVACGVEIAAQQRLGFPSAITVATLKAYDEWTSKILGTGAGSVQSFIVDCAKEHDRLISKAAEFPWAKEGLKIEDFKLSAGTDETHGYHFCVIMSKPPLSGPAFPDLAERLDLFDALYGRASAYLETGTIKAIRNEELDARLLEYQESYSESMWVERTDSGPFISGFMPKRKPWCYGDGPYPALKNKVAIRESAKRSRAYGRFTVERASVEALISSANVERAKIAFAVKSRLCSLNAQSEIRRILGMFTQ